MREHAPSPQGRPPRAEYRHSPPLQFGRDINLPGDPATTEDFTRALSYLENITEHFLEFGPLEEKTAWDVAYELSHHNAWHQVEVEQERKAGEKRTAYREITLAHLQALSKRRLLALAKSGREGGPSLLVAQFIDQLIEQAVAKEEAFERLTTPAPQERAV